MALTREKAKGRKSKGSFTMLPHSVLDHPNFAALSNRAVRLLVDMTAQFRGKNNGDLCAAMSVMKKRGWNSSDQLCKAKSELIESGWIVQTRQGGLGMGPSLFAITFWDLHECNGKLDNTYRPGPPLGYWRKGYNPKLNPPVRHTAQSAPPHGSDKGKST